MRKWDWLSHATILRETVFEGFIVNVEPLRIGSGRGLSLEAITDLAILRISYGGISVPYIPGSSLKGVFRSCAMLLAKHGGLDVCTGLSKETCGEVKKIGDKNLNELIAERMKSSSKDAMGIFYKNACLMCKIFGSTSYMGNVFFSDAYPIDENGQITSVRTGVRIGVAIDRRTGAAYVSATREVKKGGKGKKISRAGSLYKVELVEPGARFRFKIFCRNLPTYAIGLLSLVLKRINEGIIKVGGFKSRGFGAVKIEGLRFKNRDFMTKQSQTMASLEPEVDVEIDLTGVTDVRDGWLVSEGKNAWEVLDKLIEAWDTCREKLKKV